VVLVLLAVLNLSTVLVAWGFERSREMAVRVALGAKEASVTRLLILQNLLVTAMGASVGLALSLIALPLLRAMDVGPTLALFLETLELDPAVLAVSAATAGAAGLFAGFVPARLTTRGGTGTSVRAGGRSSTLSPAAVRWQKAMVLAQVTLTVVLGSAGALVAMSLRKLAAVDTGFVAGGKVVARVQMNRAEYNEHDARAAFAARLMDALARERTLSAYGFTSTLPVGDGTWGARFFVDLADGSMGTEPLLFHIRRTSANYHEVAGIPIRRGRAFAESDDARSPKVAIVSEALAARLWPGEVPVGKPLYRLLTGNQPPERLEIVGVAADAIDAGAAAPAGETVYVPYAQISVNRMSIVVEARGGAAAAGEAIRRALREADPLLAAANLSTLASLERQANALPRLQTMLLTGFGLIAGGIVALGSFGVMSQLVSTRKKELALRLVFGATPRGIGGSVITQAAAVALPGVLLGVLLVPLLAGPLQPLVFGVETGSLVVGAWVGAGTLLLVALATLAPAARAMRVDPGRGVAGES
jgi:predicted permease